MNRTTKIFVLLLGLLQFAIGLKAVGNAASENVLSVQNVTVENDQTECILPITLDNEAAITGFQVDLYLPEGLTVATEDNDGNYAISVLRTESGKHRVSALLQPNGALRIVCRSITNYPFQGNSGSVMNIKLNIADVIHAGTYQVGLKNIVMTDASSNRFTSPDVICSFTKQELIPITIKGAALTMVYGDQLPELTFDVICVEEGILRGTPMLTCDVTPTSPVGTYPIVVSMGSITNKAVTLVNGTLTITKAPLTVRAGDYTKKQYEAMPTFTPIFEGFKNDEDNTVLTKQPVVSCKATDSSDPGNYNITIGGTEAQNYEITHVNGKLTVTQAGSVIVTARSYTREYGESNPVFEYETIGETYGGNPVIRCYATATSAVGDYPIYILKGSVVNGNAQYVNGTLTITKAPLTVKAGDYAKQQGDAMPTFTPTFEGFKNNETKSVLSKQPLFSCEATVNSVPGEYEVTVSNTEAKNYEITHVNGKLTVTQPNTVTITARNYTREYGEANPAFGWTVSGNTFGGNPIVECEATADSPVGTYPIIIKQGSIVNTNGQYVNGALTITKAPLTIKAGEYTKKQGEAMPQFAPTFEGFKNNETSAVLTKQPTVSCEATAISGPGTYAVTISGAEAQNYDITHVNGKLTVTKATLVTLTARSYTREYGEDNPEFGFDANGETLGGMPVIECSATKDSPVGSYQITIKRGSVVNTNVKYVYGTLTIKKAPLTIKARNYTKKQGENNPVFTPTFEGFKNDETRDVLTNQPIIRCGAQKNSVPGEYAVEISGAEARNYAITHVNGILTVENADEVILTARSYTREYGKANPSFGYDIVGETLGGQPAIECAATKDSPVGIYPIIIKQGSVVNTNGQYVNGTLTITKAPLTIKAGNYTKKQGEAMPKFTPTYEGFKNNETSTVLTKQPAIVCSATANSIPGDYDVTVSGAEAENYEISYVNGKLTITDASAVILTARSYTREYGEANPEFAFDVNGETLGGQPVIECAATAASPVGTYPIVIKQGSIVNTNGQYVNGTLTITKAPLTISAGTYTKKQGEAMPEFTPTYEGFKNNETSTVLTKQPVIVCSTTVNSIPGEYDVTVSGAEAENYEITYVNGKLTVTDASAVILTARSYTREYGEVNPEFSYDINGETLGGQPVIECAATAASPVGTYPIVIKQGSVVNTNGQYVNGTLTITKAPLTISAGTYTKKQGEPMPEFTLSYDGFKNNETKEALTRQAIASCEADETSAPGEYDVMVSGAEAENYEITYLTGKLIVTSSGKLGDVNSDEAIDVTDAVLIIDYILQKNPANFDESVADVNTDGEIDVTDVVMVIDAILGKMELARTANFEESVDKSAYTAFQMDLMIPAGYVLESVELTEIAKDSHKLAYNMLADGRCRVVVCSMSNEALPGAWDEVIRLNLRGQGEAQVNADRAIFVTVGGERHELLLNGTTSITQHSALTTQHSTTVYDLQGCKVEKATKGLYIVNGRKIVIK